MSGILNAACCCTDQSCQRKRPFEVTMRYRAAYQRHMKFAGNRSADPPPPPCPPVSLVCDCPELACVAVLDNPTQPCSIINREQNLVSYLDTSDLVISVPYWQTTTETQGIEPACGWRVDLGAGPVQSGMTFTGQREVDRNYAVVKYDLNYSTCARCVEVDVNASGATDVVLHVDYRWRCLYLAPPSYFSVRREVSGIYLNWSYEINGGQFVVKNALGVIVSSVNLLPLTLAQARAAIDALAGVQCIANFGTIPANTMPASLIEDKANALLPLAYQPVPLFAPLSREVEWYQHGNYGPSWTVYTRLGSNPNSGAIALSIKYPLKAACDPSSADFTGGTGKGAELSFCKCIAAQQVDLANTYDPFNDPNFATYGLYGAGVFGIGWLGSWSINCSDPSPQYVWTPPDCSSPPDPGFGWGFLLGPYGTRATTCGTGMDICSDASVPVPTYCYTYTDSESDLCGCGEAVDNYCLRYEEVSGWHTAKYFEVARV
jgi:hypothetical protein